MNKIDKIIFNYNLMQKLFFLLIKNIQIYFPIKKGFLNQYV